MGIVNVTADSFSDGGRYFETDAAIAHGLELARAGADILDIGGESTRPGAARVAAADEQARVLPVIAALADAGLVVSVDTMNSETALAAARAGASYINDVSGGLADPAMPAAAASTGLPFIAMHWRGPSDVMTSLAHYDDVVAEVRSELLDRVRTLTEAGVARDKLVIDPGLGFAKLAEHDWRLLAHLDAFTELGLPVLVGASRKRFLGPLLPAGAPASDRDAVTAVVSALAAQAGVWAVRVHDVAATRSALDVVEAWQGGMRD
ncbi:dihydropteroate synthase [Compostimonas suwonensis]|nr:dihydropteroate synthase [Compostimonas suwonensis]